MCAAITDCISHHRKLSEGFIVAVVCVHCGVQMWLDGCGCLFASPVSYEVDPQIYPTASYCTSGLCVLVVISSVSDFQHWLLVSLFTCLLSAYPPALL